MNRNVSPTSNNQSSSTINFQKICKATAKATLTLTCAFPELILYRAKSYELESVT